MDRLLGLVGACGLIALALLPFCWSTRSRRARCSAAVAWFLSSSLLLLLGLVYQERDGTTLFCHANYQAMDETLGSLTKVCCIDAKGRAEDAA